MPWTLYQSCISGLARRSEEDAELGTVGRDVAQVEVQIVLFQDLADQRQADASSVALLSVRDSGPGIPPDVQPSGRPGSGRSRARCR